MILLSPHQIATLSSRFLPDRPGPLIGLHIIHTGNGACYVDQWPAPAVILVNTGGNYALSGSPNHLKPEALRPLISGFLEASDPFAPILRQTFPDLEPWDRIVFRLTARPELPMPAGASIRRLTSSDAFHLWGLSPGTAWISKTWGGPDRLAASGYGWGAFINGRLASIACTFFLGEHYEDIGVVTEPEFRGLGLSAACTAALCGDILDREHQPSWTTSPDNKASIRVAEKIGFEFDRRDRLFVIGVKIPQPPWSNSPR